MATYCIGDLHGRYDLFMMMLDKIQFNFEDDHIYLLGDVIDGEGFNGKTESIKIIEYVMAHSDSITLLRGNHEEHFLDIQDKYYGIICDIEKGISREEIKQKYKELFSKNRHKTAKFATEILETSKNKYLSILEFIKSTPPKKFLHISDIDFHLSHNIKYERNIHIKFRHCKTSNIYYIFGHTPVPLIHKDVGVDANREYIAHNSFTFNYCKIFSYIDIDNNHYYNLDTGSNPISALCLDNMNEFYVGIPRKTKETSAWNIPIDTSRILTGHTNIDEVFFVLENNKPITISNSSRKKYAFASIKDNCYEYLIGIDKSKNNIIYTRVDWLDYRYAFIINENYTGQSNEEIIDLVHQDFIYRLKNEDVQLKYNSICGEPTFL